MENTEKITEVPDLTDGTLHDYVKRECEEAGISIYRLCKESGTNRSVVEQWKKSDPKTIQVLRRMQEVINKHKSCKK